MVVEILPTGSRVTLADGSVVLGEPHDTEDYRFTSYQLGYDGDILKMAQEHDSTHAWLCSALGLDNSQALRQAAGFPYDQEVAAAEENAVMSIQRLCRLLGVELFVDGDRKA